MLIVPQITFVPSEKTKVYRAQETTDERGGLGADIGFYRSKIAAETAAAGRGWYGGNARVSSCWIVTVEGRFYPVETYYEEGIPVEMLDKDMPKEAQRLRAAAWEKLTTALSPQEIEILNIKAPK